MSMTHYMQLLADNQPWNLLIFMAVPVILAETLAITELAILFTRKFTGWYKELNRWAGILAGVYFAGIFLYLLFNAVVPLTSNDAWLGIIDVIAVSFYLLGVVPLVSILLLELGVTGRKCDDMGKLKIHAFWVGVFLVVAHIAMIFGMLDPSLLSGMQHGGGMH